MIARNSTPTLNVRAKSFRIAPATASDRERIYQLRHEVYARELRQHSLNGSGQLTDALDSFNHYLCAWAGDNLAGFVSLTPPAGKIYSIDKYVARDRLPFPVDDHLFEVRILTVAPSARGREVAALLMYAATALRPVVTLQILRSGPPTVADQAGVIWNVEALYGVCALAGIFTMGAFSALALLRLERER